MSVRRRLERLEALGLGQQSGREAWARGTPPALRKYFEAVADRRREEAGLCPIKRPYTREDKEYDQDTLERVIPRYRESPGWQTERGRAFLDAWEDEIRHKLEKGSKND